MTSDNAWPPLGGVRFRLRGVCKGGRQCLGFYTVEVEERREGLATGRVYSIVTFRRRVYDIYVEQRRPVDIVCVDTLRALGCGESVLAVDTVPEAGNC